MSVISEEVSNGVYESDEAPTGSSREGYTTYIESSVPLKTGIIDFFIREITGPSPSYRDIESAKNRVMQATRDEELYITVHECWSGYSEYTVTGKWEEISIKWGNRERHFEGMAQFFRAIADAAVAGDEDSRSH